MKSFTRTLRTHLPIHLALATAAFCSCSTTHEIRSADDDRLSEEMKRKSAILVLNDGREAAATGISFSPESVAWNSKHQNATSSVRRNDMLRVVRRDHLLGAVEGLGLGLLGGAVTGALVGQAAQGHEHSIVPSWFVGGVYAGGAGGALGMITGAAPGHSYNYELVSDTPTVNLDSVKGNESAPTMRPAAVPEEEPTSVCWRAQRKASCDVNFFTDFGAYWNPASSDNRSQGMILADWGALLNVGENDALGASLCLAFDKDEFSLGPEFRYRRWIGSEQFFDVAVGTMLLGEAKTSLYGVVKWNPAHWFGIALRPEWRRTTAPPTFFVDPRSGVFQFQQNEESRFHMWAGVEFGWWPGLALTTAGSLVLLALFIALSGMH